MAQDQKKALDNKTRKLSGGKVEEGKEHSAYQETQQQLLAIQAEQQQNLAVARAESKASFDNNQTLAQAAELGAINAAEAEQAAQAGGQVTLNPATQSVLAKYGVGQPKFQRTQSHNQQVTKQNITINNNITSNTTNDVTVPAGIGGPLQGRPLQIRNPQVVNSPAKASTTDRFKTWISAAFARQNEEGAKRDREYRQRESSLTKSANRMMKKLEDIGKTIGTRMDPRKIGSTWQSQLKTLLLLFGFGYLTSNWNKILERVAGVEKWVKDTWGYFTGNVKDGESSFVSDIKSFFGGKGEESLFDVFKKLLGNEGLFGYIKEYFNKLYEDRAEAVKEVEFPKIDTGSIFNTLESLSEYLGNLFGAIVGGTESVKKTISKQTEKAALNESLKNYQDHGRTTTTETTEIGDFKGDKGTLSLLDGSYKGLTAYSIDKEGNLDKSNLTEATLAASSEATRVKELINNGDISQTASLVQQLNRLYTTAKDTKNKYVAVTKEFIDSLTKDELQDLISRKLIQKTKYRVIYHEKSKSDLDDRENLDPNMRAADMYATQKTAHTLGGRLGSFATGNYASAIFGSWGAGIAGATEYGLTALDRYLANDGRFTLVRSGEKLKTGDHDTGETRELYEISPEGIKIITNRLSNRKLDEEIDMEDKSSLQEALNSKEVENKISEINRIEKKTKEKLEEVRNSPIEVQANSIYPYKLENNLEKINRIREDVYNQAQSGYVSAGNTINNLTARGKQINADFEANTSGNRAVTTWNNMSGAAKKAYNTVVEAGGKVASAVGIQIKSSNEQEINKEVANIKTHSLSPIQEKRAKYAVRRLMEEGLSKSQAAGIVGNIIRESRLDPTAGHTDNNGLHAGGIVQWNGPRYDAATKYFGKPVEQVSFEDQLEYVIKELKGEIGGGATERSGFLRKHGFKKGDKILDVMKSTTSLQDSTDTFERIYEGSGDYEGYWTNKGKPNAKRHSGDKNKSRHELAATVYKISGGDLSETNFEYEKKDEIPSSATAQPQSSANLSSTTQSQKSKPGKVEEKSFWSILKEETMKLISDFGGIFGGDNEEIPVQPEEVTPKQDIMSQPPIEPVSVPAEEVNIAQQDVREDTKNILERYIKSKEPNKETTTISSTTPPKVDPLISQNLNTSDQFDLINSTESKQNPTYIFGNLTNNIIKVKNGVDTLIELTAMNGNILSESVDAVNRGTSVAAGSSSRFTQAIMTQNRNEVKSTVSLDSGYDNSLKNLTS